MLHRNWTELDILTPDAGMSILETDFLTRNVYIIHFAAGEASLEASLFPLGYKVK